jgi:hypothetical protein
VLIAYGARNVEALERAVESGSLPGAMVYTRKK